MVTAAGFRESPLRAGKILGTGEGAALAVDDRRVTGSGTRGWHTAATGGVLVWLAVKAALAVLVRGVAEIITFGAPTDTSAVR